MSPDQRLTETEINQQADKSVEAGLRALWDRARRAAELISELRKDRAQLHKRVEDLETLLRQAQQESGNKEQRLRELSAEHARLDAKRDPVFADGERAALAAKVKELLARLDAYL